MALTLDILKAQEGLSGLTDEQLNSIVGLSERDEQAVIDRKYGELRGQVDTIIAAESAIKRNDGEKSSDYLTRALKAMKAAADEGITFKDTNVTLTAEIEKLKKDIAEGKGNEQLKADLEKVQKELAAAKKINTELQEAQTKAASEYKGKLEGFRMDSELSTALSGIALKKELPEATRQALLRLAKQNVMASKHVYDETAGSFIFQDAEGNPLKDKSLNNLTVANMLTAELERMGVLDTGRQQGGAGGQGGQGGHGGQGGATADLSSAKTQSEAHDIVERQLMEQGHAKSDSNWQETFDQVWKDNLATIEKLPLY